MLRVGDRDSIVAIATPPGIGGLGIVRFSGPLVPKIAQAVLGFLPPKRQAVLSDFLDQKKQVLDRGIAIYYPGPNSYTGEDVLELQAHGNPLILKALMQEGINLGLRIAEPGEFTLRAFLNNKMDLLQAEAVSSLIHAQTEQAAKSAFKSLQGDFSKAIFELKEKLVQLRIIVEAALDFPEEDVTLIENYGVISSLETIRNDLKYALKTAEVGKILTEGIKVVILGKPNAGKSSFLNSLSGTEAAIVSEIPGTTRDLIRETINWDGLLVNLVDTAGLRESQDAIEQEGIKRAWKELEQADYIFILVDLTQGEPKVQEYDQFPANIPKIIILNKIDLLGLEQKIQEDSGITRVWLSSKTELGIPEFRDYFSQKLGLKQGLEGTWSARTRHVEALKLTLFHLEQGLSVLSHSPEILAEELRLAQEQLSLLTGDFTSDDLLGRIFSDFCIGK
ncbi:MAG: tRNA uridine-5-carboxymethylaminomethyl(34) synthesis GTPase MnmE [Gammaproteobacteria bacterium]